ncbi:MAG: helix-turn-helix domain-containing protein [Cyclobacteriaceae bacterium]|nr:helix-turn-helix domain-containing protein [Cyclobacteriaceae bacterium HetDA_MAG_MS6]
MSIADNIKFLRKKAGYTQEQFAQQVGIKRSVVGAYEEGRAEPRLQTLSKIAEVLNTTADAMINQDLTTGKIPGPAGERVKVLSITVDENDRENIELVPQKAAAGYLNGFADPEYVAELPKFRLPMLPGNATYRAFEIHGDSMLPLVSGVIVIGKYLESINDIKNGKTYVLVTQKEGVVYKRVFNYLEERGKLYLVSDNKNYSAYEVDPIDVEEIWEAIAFISIQFPDPNTTTDISLEKLTGMVLNLQDDISNIKKGLERNDS